MSKALWAGFQVRRIGWVCACLEWLAPGRWRGSRVVYEELGFFQTKSSCLAGWASGYEEGYLGNSATGRYASATMYQALLPFPRWQIPQVNSGRL